MPRELIIQIEQDYQDTYSDFTQVSEMVLESTGEQRQALLNLRTILKNTIKVMEKELNKWQEL
jgi:hypothetical protein